MKSSDEKDSWDDVNMVGATTPLLILRQNEMETVMGVLRRSPFSCRVHF